MKGGPLKTFKKLRKKSHNAEKNERGLFEIFRSRKLPKTSHSAKNKILKKIVEFFFDELHCAKKIIRWPSMLAKRFVSAQNQRWALRWRKKLGGKSRIVQKKSKLGPFGLMYFCKYKQILVQCETRTHSLLLLGPRKSKLTFTPSSS